MELPLPFPLPNDIIFNILMRLSIKSLLTLRCVCKNLNSIIKSHDFMNNYRVSRPQSYLFFHSRDYSNDPHKPKSFSIFSANASFELEASEFEVEIPSVICGFCSNPGDCVVVGSCDGLLCLTDNNFFGREVCLWNPSIRKHKILPESCLFNGKFSQFFYFGGTSMTIVGLGFDSKTNDFKILRFTCFRSRSKSRRKPEAEIYRLSSDSWRSVAIPDHLVKRFVLMKSKFYAYVNGGLHWLGEFIREEGVHYSSILRFDVCEERFTEVEIPKDYPHGIRLDYCTKEIVALQGVLAIIVYDVEHENEGGERICYVWRKNGSVWNKEVVKFGGKRWQCGAAGDYLILERGYKRRVFLVNPQSLKFKTLLLSRPQQCHAFSETLALL